MKCVICDKEGEYLFHGTSFCKAHLLKYFGEYFIVSGDAFSIRYSINKMRTAEKTFTRGIK